MNGGGVWCESTNAVISNCVIVGNSAGFYGGGACSGTLTNCTLAWNQSYYYGGGAYISVLNNCILTGNSAPNGGGAYSNTLNNCTLAANSASFAGGGACLSKLNNCTLMCNSAANYGGGAYSSTLNNCTLTANSACYYYGGGADSSLLNNCIVYFNTSPYAANASRCTLNNCCTTPLPDGGTGNISQDPQLASTSHISASSPCRGAGSAAYASGTDIDGEVWASPPSIGCDEYLPGAVIGPLSVSVRASFTNVAVGFAVALTAEIEGRASASVWNFGDGTVVSNQPYASHAWASPGDYALVLTAYNESQPGGVSATQTVHVLAQVYYVSASSSNPVAPYNSWVTAATNIQTAVNAASLPGALILVTNGVYTTGGRVVYGTMTNRVAVTRPLRVQSVNGPQFTVIQGYQVPGTTNGNNAIRCVYLTNGASLSGFTLTNGATWTTGDTYYEVGGGGVWCESADAVITNCTLTGNAAFSRGGGAYAGTLKDCALTGNSVAGSGGGAYYSMLNNCTLTGNSADHGGGAGYSTFNNCTLMFNSAFSGGGAFNCTLNNCTLTGNSASSDAGGAYHCTLNNCIIYFNTAASGPNFSYGTLNYCCTTPMPTNGVGNITNAPLFVDQAGGNLRLQSNSPCINSGNNTYALSLATDLDSNPRIKGGTVDMGAYEFQTPASVLSYAWAQQYGLPTDGSADYLDPDGDRLNNWQECQAGTIPTNVLSVLRLSNLARNGSVWVVTWQSVTNRTYFVERSTNLNAQSDFSTLQSNIAGQAGTTDYTDTNAIGAGPFFYRVGVQ
jgi:hypothetical protein